tara:strand:- start:1027 stop:2052 length:1026 start_codon:yes stop_codon:yes gene_type:complete
MGTADISGSLPAASAAAQVVKLASAARPIIALSEGTDPRVVAGAVAAQSAGIADIVLIGPRSDVHRVLSAAGGQESDSMAIHDPAGSEQKAELAKTFYQLRKHKGMTPEVATKAVQDPLIYAALLVHLGQAHGTVGGAVATTSNVVRAALQVIGKAQNAAMVSSCFLMFPPHSYPMVYSDCGLVIDPDAHELAEIAIMAAQSCRDLLGDTPKVAMLSFSTKGSAAHKSVSKVQQATELVQAAQPSLKVDGELQFDAAFDADVGAAKAAGSAVAGRANVMVFPNLDAGNIGYKITQRLGGATAIGPILQGLAKPANDLSRGCTGEDVTQMIAVTVLQHLGSL